MRKEGKFSMARINGNYDKLAAGYLFPEIGRRTRAFLERNPGAAVMRLGIGDTTEPLGPTIVAAMVRASENLGNAGAYSGYGDEQGNSRLRQAIASHYASLGVAIDPGEVFVSDGAKCDSANIQSIFSQDSVVAVQDPAYPVYVDTNVIAGRTGGHDGSTYEGLIYMPCHEGNGFIPQPPVRKVDLIYLCSPNNPTGAVATREELQRFVDYAVANKAVIIYDAAYSEYISDAGLPRTIYSIPGAEKCAIEINSFSKYAGFTGVRLGWTIVPKAIETEDSQAGRLNALWNRRQCTMFNGASNVAQEGGIAALSPQGRRECLETVEYYKGNARVIVEGLNAMGLAVYGGVDAPFVWVKTPHGMKSWDFFDKLLSEAHVVGTPGSGFGPSGEGFLRLSAFGHRENIERAVGSIRENLKI